MYRRKTGSDLEWFSKDEIILGNVTQAITEQKCGRSKTQVLDLGCGTSDLSKKIFCTLYKTPMVLHCLDFVPSAVEYQSKTFSSCDTNMCMNVSNSKVVFLVADALQLPYPPNFFHVIVDKGTTDSALRSAKPGRIINSHAIINQTVTCIKPGGVVIQITDEDPDSRLMLIEEAVKRLNFSSHEVSITHIELCTNDPFQYFMYFIRKLR